MSMHSALSLSRLQVVGLESTTSPLVANAVDYSKIDVHFRIKPLLGTCLFMFALSRGNTGEESYPSYTPAAW